jgi:aminopeptidase N
MKPCWPVLSLVVLASACASAPPARPTDLALGDPARRDRTLAIQANVILDARTGDRLDADALAARLEGKRLVFFGETHAQPAVQAGERQLLDALARRGRRVLVGLEMLPASVQPALDRWVRGEGSEDDLIRDSHWYRHWGFHFGHYRDLFLFARQARTPMVALNVEREVISTVRRSGFEGLSPADRGKLPAQVDLASAEHRQLFTAFMGGEHSGMTPAEMEGMFRAQCTWDAVMGHNAVKALAAESDPRAVMVVMVGFGHVAYGLGAERQAVALGGGPLTASVVAMAAVDDEGRPSSVRASLGDFLWGTPADSEEPAFPSLGASLSDKPGASGPTVIIVRAGSPAQKAGVLEGDVVAGIDGQSTADKEAVLIKVGSKAWGDRLAIDVLRGGQRQTLTAILMRAAPAGAAPAMKGDR